MPETTKPRSTTRRPADTVTMSLFHAALRRDLERARVLLEAPQLMPRQRAQRLGRQLLWATQELRRHHEGEDHFLWPLLLSRSPESHDVLDAMESEHHQIDAPLLQLEAAARGLVAGRTVAKEVLDALDALEGPLLRHLDHEESDGMRIATRVLSDQEWRDFEKRAWATGYTAGEALRFLVWMCDGVTWDVELSQRMRLPRLVRWSVAVPLSHVAKVPILSVWAGTPASRVMSPL